MTNKNKDNKLPNMFEEFPPVTREEWENQILQDLNGLDYKKELLWEPPEDLSLLPFYMSDDLTALEQNADEAKEKPMNKMLTKRRRNPPLHSVIKIKTVGKLLKISMPRILRKQTSSLKKRLRETPIFFC